MSPRFSASAPLDSMSEEELMVPERLALSFEVIPPRHDADEAKIDRLLENLESYHPDYIAVTSSKRSGWLEGTTAFIERISRTTSMRPLAHLACTAGSRTELIGWINRLVDADELISLIRQLERQQAARFAAGRLAVGVACYPSGHVESKNEDEDFDVLLKKQRLGADFAITQLFFDAQDYLRFTKKAQLAGVHIPLIPGIMPMTSLRRVERMGELSGLAVPERVRSALAAATTPEEEYETGMELTAELARDIVAGGASGLHIYTHNNPDNTHDLLTRIGVDNDQR